jgi:hypothetical protein
MVEFSFKDREHSANPHAQGLVASIQVGVLLQLY